MRKDCRFKWVQVNRGRTDRVRHVGPLIEGLLQRRIVTTVAAAQEAAVAITAVVDDEFRARCRVAVPDKRTLVVNVDSAALVYSMRLRWLSPLLRVLSGSGGGPVFERIAFEFGTAGVRVEGPTDSRG